MNNTLVPNNSSVAVNQGRLLGTSTDSGVDYAAYGGSVNGAFVLVLSETTYTGTGTLTKYYVADPDADFDTVWAARAVQDYAVNCDLTGLVLPFNDPSPIGQSVGDYIYLAYTPEAADPVWRTCLRANGGLQLIADYPKLFAVLGTLYGGDGVDTFGLPNAKMRVLAGPGSIAEVATWNVGNSVGALKTTLAEKNLPAHSHLVNATGSNGNTGDPRGFSPTFLGAYPANTQGLDKEYSTSIATLAGNMASGMIAPTGNGQPFENTQLTLIAEILIIAK